MDIKQLYPINSVEESISAQRWTCGAQEGPPQQLSRKMNDPARNSSLYRLYFFNRFTRLLQIFARPMSAVQIGLVPQVPQMFGTSHRARLSLALDHHTGPVSHATVPTLKRSRKDLDHGTKSRIGGSGSTTPTTPPTHSKPWFRTMEIADLCDRLTGPGSTTHSQQFLVLDCRSFVSYNVMHVRNAFNVNCGDRINRRRLQSGKAGVEDLMSSREARDMLRKKSVNEVLVYDDSTMDIDLNSTNSSHPLLLIISCLLELKKDPILLRGKSFTLSYRPTPVASNLMIWVSIFDDKGHSKPEISFLLNMLCKLKGENVHLEVTRDLKHNWTAMPTFILLSRCYDATVHPGQTYIHSSSLF